MSSPSSQAQTVMLDVSPRREKSLLRWRGGPPPQDNNDRSLLLLLNVDKKNCPCALMVVIAVVALLFTPYAGRRKGRYCCSMNRKRFLCYCLLSLVSRKRPSNSTSIYFTLYNIDDNDVTVMLGSPEPGDVVTGHCRKQTDNDFFLIALM